jgi:hypothetical protein
MAKWLSKGINQWCENIQYARLKIGVHVQILVT